MNLLDEGIGSGNVIKTEQVVKHTIDGQTGTYPVYKIRIDELFYNNHNDRIASYLSKYRVDHGDLDPTSLPRDEYNDIIEGFIVESNTDAIRTTQKNIATFGQRVPGVVLNNGLVIDGNRRLTCIRRISKEEKTPGWFEAVILSDAIASDPKRIKILELTIQHGEEGKVGYTPIERLVGVYEDIIKSGLLTPAEYARSTDQTEKQINQLMEQATLMEEFLEFCNAPEQYHIARELLIAGPIGEIPAILKKCKTEGEKQRTKEYLFANIVAQPAGDITRFVRKFKKIIGTDFADEFYGAEQTAFSRLIPVMGADPINMEKVRAIRENDSISGEFERSMRRTETKLHESRLKNAPATKSQNALSDLSQIHPAMLRKMSTDERDDLRYALRSIISKCEGLIEECDRID